MEQHKPLAENSVRVIKIGKDALYEFIYEQMIEHMDQFFDVDRLEVSCAFDLNFEAGEFIFCVYQDTDNQGEFVELSQEIDWRKVMKYIPETTSTLYTNDRYREYSMEQFRAFLN